MPASHVPSLGDRIREERTRRGVSLRSLARDVGVSASMISQIETGKSRPSVSTLYAITNALGMSLQEVFDLAGTPEAAATALVGAGAAGEATPRLPTTVLEALSARGPRLGPLVRPPDRRVLTLDSGVTWERLGELPPLHVDFLLMTYAPGGSSSSTGDLMRHPGWEWGYLLHGELVLTLGFEEIVIRPRDAVSFDSTTPHRYRNDGTVPAAGVWFVVEDRP
jgi:transcriptional regulator with XRE-family HTH domain